MNYEELNFKIPRESEDYEQCSNFVVYSIDKIISDAMDYRTQQNYY